MTANRCIRMILLSVGLGHTCIPPSSLLRTLHIGPLHGLVLRCTGRSMQSPAYRDAFGRAFMPGAHG